MCRERKTQELCNPMLMMCWGQCWSSPCHAELHCCALHIGNGLHGICIKIKKEQSQQYHYNTSSLFTQIHSIRIHLVSTIFECYWFWRFSFCGKLSIGRLSVLRDLICFLTEKNIFFRNTSSSPGSELWELSLLAQTRDLRRGRCQLPTVSIFSQCT